MRCNLSCSFCDTTYRHKAAKDELSISEWIRIVEDAAKIGVKQVYVLGGGEPFLKKNILSLLKTIKKHGMYGMITTNGSLIDAQLSQALLDMNWDEIHFSIDGSNAETHDTLRGQHGSFRKAVQTACRLSTMRERYNKTTPRIVIHTVVTNQNYTELPAIVSLAHAIKASRVDFDSLIAYRPEQNKLQLTPAQQRHLPRIAKEAHERATEFQIETTLQNFLQSDRVERGHRLPAADKKRKGLSGAPCLKAWHHLVIQNDGKTAPCCVLSGSGGSIKGTTVSELWIEDTFLKRVRSAMEAHNPIDRCRECSWNILRHEAEIRKHLPENSER
ncbi:MAG: radical SAM protein [Myxococcota bacterium]|nr:radical SAM protein [Myxococcota bacterium]